MAGTNLGVQGKKEGSCRVYIMLLLSVGCAGSKFGLELRISGHQIAEFVACHGISFNAKDGRSPIRYYPFSALG